ncbi:MAG: type II secretion system GspH family protein [Candidatus Nomurabacteria bacterium]|jgi:prepilin-type N-terminal cleavage/methylation domain-containing protein|nr:type II secretion system GspH family protein [Candidatus Nomurabacteria bacterium]
MKRADFKQAFTIIEVMLVLAIVGLLFVGLIGSAQSTIRKQRYNDSVQTFENTLQEQYDLVSNIQNTRPLSESIQCTPNSSSVTLVFEGTNNASYYRPGMSKCLVYGRLVEFKDMGQNGKREVKVSNVIGLEPGGAEKGPDQSEISTFKNALVSKEKLGTTDRSETLQMQWSSWLREPRVSSGVTPVAVTGGLLILRSPVSGTIWTYKYTGDITGVSLKDKVEAANAGSRSFCIMSDDAEPKSTRAVVAGGSGVFTGANSSAVQIAPLDKPQGSAGDFNYVPTVDCT